MGWLFPLKRIEQVDMHGCGIAATATVCGITYERARAEFFPRRKRFVDDMSLHVGGDQMLAVVQRLGFSAKMVSGCPDRQKNPTIVIISWYPGDPNCTHAVVWDPFKKKIYDPGPDSNYGHPNKFYFDMWRKTRYTSFVVTGRL